MIMMRRECCAREALRHDHDGRWGRDRDWGRGQTARSDTGPRPTTITGSKQRVIVARRVVVGPPATSRAYSGHLPICPTYGRSMASNDGRALELAAIVKEQPVVDRLSGVFQRKHHLLLALSAEHADVRAFR